ncbi:MAG: tripartite tricarboxylate transporter substrate binding protein [Variovorax paradoxus]|nr:tripartite tricarboxylate transporter substrate-binding protein [Variovorax paradoxus]MBW8719934.1 tripartite tricarboxylate transporter substrate binding protein [Variovorax paradoxus]
MNPTFNLPHPNRRQMLAGLASFASFAAVGTGGTAFAQGAKYPSKAVTLVVPYSAGGGTDIVGRLMAQRLSELWGQSVVVDNRTGANGVIGSSTVARSAPDGHTLLLVVGSHAVNPVLMKSLPYDTDKAFTPITNTAARKEELGCGYSEGQTRLTGELIRQVGHLKLTGVPYKGGAPIMVDIIGGHLPMGVTSVLTALPHVRSGALRVVGVAADRRMPLFPDAMTFKEAGLNGVESLSWYGLFGPAGLPAPIVAQINQDLKKVAADPVVQKQMHDQGADITLTPPAEFRTFLASETKKWSLVAQRGGITAE